MSKVVDNEYNGKPMFTIRKTDEDGEVIPQKITKPIVNMGITKVTAIMENIDAFTEYYEANKKQ